MPGITLSISNNPNVKAMTGFSKAQQMMVHGPNYQITTWIDKPHIRSGFVAYPEYPIITFEDCGNKFLVEGRIYNKNRNTVEKELKQLGLHLSSKPSQVESGVGRWIHDTQGSYVVAVVSDDCHDFTFFTDPFCRLPLYYYLSQEAVILAREPKFIQQLKPSPSFDRIGWAQWLAFGLPLGSKTLHEGINSFPDAGLLRVKMENGGLRVTLSQQISWNFDESTFEKPIREQVSQYVDLFVSACRNWGSHPDSGQNLVSLSGGHDSRMVLAGFSRAGIDVQAATYRDPNGRRDGELSCARQLTTALKVNWKSLEIPKATTANEDRIIWLKDGLNWSTMAYILTYLEKIHETWGPRTVYLTGDGGNDCLDVCAPSIQLKTVDDAVDYVSQQLVEIPICLAEDIMKVKPGTLREVVYEMLKTYPENDPRQKIKHYKICERGRRCYFEGEDRARFFFWEDSPFYSLPVHRHCMLVPDSLKEYHKFCRAALCALSPIAAKVPIFPLGVAPESFRYPLAVRLQEYALHLPNWMRAMLRHLAHRPTIVPYRPSSEYSTRICNDLSDDPTIANMINPDALKKSLGFINAKSQFYLIWSLLRLANGSAEKQSFVFLR